MRRQLDIDLRSVRVQQFTLPADIHVDVPLSPEPEQQTRQERRRSRRPLVAVAAAIAASVAVGVVVDELVVDDDSEPPAATLPTPTLPSTSVVGPTTAAAPATSRSDQADNTVAAASLLSDSDDGIDTLQRGSGDGGVRLLSELVGVLPACSPFASTVFESPERPAALNSRLSTDDHSMATAMIQYVAVLPSVEQAVAMIDGIQDPRFIAECVPAYTAYLATQGATFAWFPFDLGEALESPVFSVNADGVWVHMYKKSRTDGDGVVHNGPEQHATAAIRVERVISVIDLMLTDADGNTVATVAQFEAIVQRAAERAAAAQ